MTFDELIRDSNEFRLIWSKSNLLTREICSVFSNKELRLICSERPFLNMKTQTLNLSTLLEEGLGQVDSCDYVEACLLLDCHCDLGEGIIYDDRKQWLLWTDINLKQFHKLDLTDIARAVHTVYDLPKMLGSFGLLDLESESLPLLCAWEDSFQLYDMELQKSLGEESRGERVNPSKGGSRLNDGRVDPHGTRFLSGGHNGGLSGVKMKVFQCEQEQDGRLTHRPIIENVTTTNSLCWNLNASKLYFADSPTHEIYSFDYSSATGDISNKTLIHKKNIDAHSFPDGSCVDSEGFIWNAVWRSGAGPGMIHRIDPGDGKVVFTVHMPDSTSQVTCCCFGGKNLDILFITSAAEGRDAMKEPHAGGLYSIRLPFKGKTEGRLKFSLK